MHLLALLAMLEIQGTTENQALKVHKVSLGSVGIVARKVIVESQVMMDSMV
jgi:hypothetical protein